MNNSIVSLNQPSSVIEDKLPSVELTNKPITSEQRQDNNIIKNQEETNNSLLHELSKPLESQIPVSITNIETKFMMGCLAKEIIRAKPDTYQNNMVPAEIVSATSTFHLKLQGWTPLKSLTLHLPIVVEEFSYGAERGIYTKRNAIPQVMYAYMAAIIKDIELRMGEHEIIVPLPSQSPISKNRYEITFNSRLLLSLRAKNKLELQRSGQLGLPYQNTFYSSAPQNFARTTDNEPDILPVPDWSYTPEALAFDQVQSKVPSTRIFSIPLHYIYPCLDSKVMLPPGFSIKLTITPSTTDQFGSIFWGIPDLGPHLSTNFWAAHYNYYPNDTALNREAFEFREITYKSYIFTQSINNHLLNHVNTIGNTWNYLSIDSYFTNRYNFTTYASEKVELFLPVQYMLPKAISFTPRYPYPDGSNIDNLKYSCDPYTWFPGSNITPTQNAIGFISEIFPYVLTSLKIFASDNPNNILYQMTRDENPFFIATNGLAYNSPKMEAQNREMSDIYGKDMYYYENRENNVQITKPYIAFISPNMDLDKLSLMETTKTKQLVMHVSYFTVNPVMVSNIEAIQPANLLSPPGLNGEILEIGLITNTKTMELNGNSLRFNSLQLSNN